MHDHKHLLKRMEKKGWSSEEIEYARLVFLENTKEHSIFHPNFDYVVHWFLFFIMLVANLSVFFYMIPIMLMLSGVVTYIVLIMFGLGLGSVFDIVVADLNHLEKHHHFFMGFIIPIITAVMFLFSIYVLQSISSSSHLFLKPLWLSCTYSISVMIPYYVRRIKNR